MSIKAILHTSNQLNIHSWPTSDRKVETTLQFQENKRKSLNPDIIDVLKLNDPRLTANSVKSQRSLHSTQSLPLKKIQTPKRIISFRVMKLGVKSSCDSKLSDLDSQVSDNKKRDKSNDSEIRSTFNLSIKKTNLSRSKTPSKPAMSIESQNIYKKFEASLADEFIMIEECQPAQLTKKESAFNNLIKERSLVRYDSKESYPSSSRKIEVLERKNYYEETSADDASSHNIYANLENKNKVMNKIRFKITRKVSSLANSPKNKQIVGINKLLKPGFKSKKAF